MVEELTEELTYCEVHPDRETGLRCNRCGRLMCVECAVQTSVGYRCRQCVRSHEDKFYTATQNDSLTVFGVCLGLSAVLGFLVGSIHLPLLFSLILAFPIGGAIGEAALRATQRRRGRNSDKISVAGVVVGGFLGGMANAYFAYTSAINEMIRQSGSNVPSDMIPGPTFDMMFTLTFNDIGLLLFIGIAAAAVYGRYQMRI